MRQRLILSAVTLAAVLGLGGRAAAFGRPVSFGYGAYPGWGGVGNYYYPPMYPWFAYYDYSSSPYAWGGYQPPTYGGSVYGYADPIPAAPETPNLAPVVPTPAKVAVTVPADAALAFNGHPTNGTGPTRTFHTGPLEPGKEYQYVLTATVVRDGREVVATERVTVRAGGTAAVTLAPKGEPAAVAAR